MSAAEDSYSKFVEFIVSSGKYDELKNLESTLDGFTNTISDSIQNMQKLCHKIKTGDFDCTMTEENNSDSVSESEILDLIFDSDKKTPLPKDIDINKLISKAEAQLVELKKSMNNVVKTTIEKPSGTINNLKSELDAYHNTLREFNVNLAKIKHIKCDEVLLQRNLELEEKMELFYKESEQFYKVIQAAETIASSKERTNPDLKTNSFRYKEDSSRLLNVLNDISVLKHRTED